MILKKGYRRELIKVLDSTNIQVRPLMTGNFINNKVIDFTEYLVSSELSRSEVLQKNGFYIVNQLINIEE